MGGDSLEDGAYMQETAAKRGRVTGPQYIKVQSDRSLRTKAHVPQFYV